MLNNHSSNQAQKLSCVDKDIDEQQHTEFGKVSDSHKANESNLIILLKKLLILAFALIIFLIFGLLYQHSKFNKFQKLYEREHRQLKYLVENNLPISISQPKQGNHSLGYWHSHINPSFSYPTVGVPKPGDKFNYTKVQQKDLAEFDQIVLDLLKPYNDTNCQFGRIGEYKDGGYVACNNFFQQSQALINFGIQSHDSFGCSLTSKYLITNYQYDCTTTKIPTCQTNNQQNVFSKVCLGDITQKGQNHTQYTFWDLLKTRNLQKKHITLKIDIQGGEYFAFKYFPTQFLDYIDQIIMEIHFGEISPEIWGNLDIIRTLTDKFVNVNLHMNNFACYLPEIRDKRRIQAYAFQVTLVNKKLIKLNSHSRSLVENKHNIKNDQNKPDCQMIHNVQP